MIARLEAWPTPESESRGPRLPRRPCLVPSDPRRGAPPLGPPLFASTLVLLLDQPHSHSHCNRNTPSISNDHRTVFESPLSISGCGCPASVASCTGFSKAYPRRPPYDAFRKPVHGGMAIGTCSIRCILIRATLLTSASLRYALFSALLREHWRSPFPTPARTNRTKNAKSVADLKTRREPSSLSPHGQQFSRHAATNTRCCDPPASGLRTGSGTPKGDVRRPARPPRPPIVLTFSGHLVPLEAGLRGRGGYGV